MTERAKIMDVEFGLESVLLAHSKYIKTKHDIIVCWLNWVLCRNNFKCVGGENSITGILSERLPRNFGWNGDKQSYLLMYERDRKTYGLGIWIRHDIVDIALVTLQKSLKVGIVVSKVVRDDLTIRPREADLLTTQMETEFIRPVLADPKSCIQANRDRKRPASFFAFMA